MHVSSPFDKKSNFSFPTRFEGPKKLNFIEKTPNEVTITISHQQRLLKLPQKLKIPIQKVFKYLKKTDVKLIKE